MSKLGGLWKYQNNPVCIKSGSLQNVEIGHYAEDVVDISRFTDYLIDWLTWLIREYDWNPTVFVLSFVPIVIIAQELTLCAD